MPKLPTPLRTFITDKHNHVVLWQRPNTPLIVWFVFAVLSRLLHGNLRTGVRFISHAAIIIWAALEVYSGASPFRRVLGAIVLLLAIVPLIASLFR
jgi:hypothetical protein